MRGRRNKAGNASKEEHTGEEQGRPTREEPGREDHTTNDKRNQKTKNGTRRPLMYRTGDSESRTAAARTSEDRAAKR